MPFASSLRFGGNFSNVTAILPPSVIRANWIRSAGNHQTALLDHGGLGEGSHAPGGIYTDEGSTNWAVSGNVLQGVSYWLMACRPGSAPIGPVWVSGNWFDSASNMTINNASRCPLVDNLEVATDASWPIQAQRVMRSAGPRQHVTW